MGDGTAALNGGILWIYALLSEPKRHGVMAEARSQLFATDEPNSNAHPELSDRMTEARRPG